MIGTLLCVASVVAGLQDPGSSAAEAFADEALVRGVVRGPDGERITGARAELVPSLSEPRRSPTFAAVWNRVRIPPLLVDPDGGLTLPLTSRHREVWTRELGSLDLVVEAPGFHRLRVPLSGSLEELVSLDVELWPVTEGDRIALELGAGRGRILLVEHGIAREVLDRVAIPVPDDGRLEVELDDRPPLAVLDQDQPRVFWQRAALLAPGRSVPFRAIVRDAAGGRWDPGAAIGGAIATVRVVRSDGGALRDVRALYRGPDGVSRWFPMATEDGGTAVAIPSEDAALRLVGVRAAGARAVLVRSGGERVELPVIADDPAVSVTVRDAAGRPVADAEVTAWPLDAVCDELPRFRVRPGLRPAARSRRSGPDGVVRFGPLADATPVAVVVRRGGSLPVWLVDPGAGAIAELRDAFADGEPAERIVRITDAAGRPIAGAILHPRASVGERLAEDRDLPRMTDARGRVALLRPVSGTRTLHCVARGFGPAEVEVAAEAGGEIGVVLEPAVEARVVAVDREGAAATWQPIEVIGGTVRSRRASGFRTDGRGLAWLRRLPELRGFALNGAQAAPPMDGEVVELRVEPQIGVMIRAPDLPDSLRIELLRGRGGSSTSTASLGLEASQQGNRLALPWSVGRGDELRIGIGTGPPLRVVDLAVQTRGARAGWAELDQRGVVRRVPIDIRGVAIAGPAEFRVEPRSPHFGGQMFSDRIGNFASVRDGRPELAFRDSGPWRLVALHPDAEPAFFEVAATVGESIRIDLTPAARVVLELSDADPRPGGSMLHVQLRSAGAVTRLQDSVPPAGGAGTVRIPLPFGLRPGAWEVERFRIGPAEFGPAAFQVPEAPSGAPLVVPVTKTD